MLVPLAMPSPSSQPAPLITLMECGTRITHRAECDAAEPRTGPRLFRDRTVGQGLQSVSDRGGQPKSLTDTLANPEQ